VTRTAVPRDAALPQLPLLLDAEAALAPARPVRRPPSASAWLEPLRRVLDRSPRPVRFFFRDDDAGWEDERLLALLDVFADHAVPLDVAVIPSALGPGLARELRARAAAAPDLLGLHQHGLAHVNHEPAGRPCEFGPSRSAAEQRRDLATGAARLRSLLGDAVAPIFTPPWNRCTETTGRCLLELGFRALARDSTATPLALPGLADIAVNVDWSAKTKDGGRIGLQELGDRLAAAAAAAPEPTGVMLHHALMGGRERDALAALLELLAAHEHADCRPMASLLRPRRARA
jgi:peptidoglycan/xylan/chitin deacetylase (PgdA/CDA1 family)